MSWVEKYRKIKNRKGDDYSGLESIHWNLLYALNIWNCLNFIQKSQLFRYLINVNFALRLFLKDKGGDKQHCLIPFVGSNLGVEAFSKKMEHQKRMPYNRGLRFQENSL